MEVQAEEMCSLVRIVSCALRASLEGIACASPLEVVCLDEGCSGCRAAVFLGTCFGSWGALPCFPCCLALCPDRWSREPCSQDMPYSVYLGAQEPSMGITQRQGKPKLQEVTGWVQRSSCRTYLGTQEMLPLLASNLSEDVAPVWFIARSLLTLCQPCCTAWLLQRIPALCLAICHLIELQALLALFLALLLAQAIHLL